MRVETTAAGDIRVTMTEEEGVEILQDPAHNAGRTTAVVQSMFDMIGETLEEMMDDDDGDFDDEDDNDEESNGDLSEDDDEEIST